MIRLPKPYDSPRTVCRVRFHTPIPRAAASEFYRCRLWPRRREDLKPIRFRTRENLAEFWRDELDAKRYVHPKIVLVAEPFMKREVHKPTGVVVKEAPASTAGAMMEIDEVLIALDAEYDDSVAEELRRTALALCDMVGWKADAIVSRYPNA